MFAYTVIMDKLLVVSFLIAAVLFVALSNSKRKIFVVQQAVRDAEGTVGKSSRKAPLPPPPHQCSEFLTLQSLVNLFEITRDWNLLIKVGDAYARGCFPYYGADSATAVQIYHLASRCPDKKVAALAMSRYVDTRIRPIAKRDSSGSPFPPDPAQKLVRHAEYHIRRGLPAINKARRQPPKVVQTPVTTPPPLTTGVDVAVTEPLDTDKQNVHDHSVAQTTKKNIRDIVAETTGHEFDNIELVDSIMSELRQSGLSEAILADAFRVLVSLVPDTIESIGCSQIDVLHAIKLKIDGVEDKRLKKNLFETLGKNLATAIERDHVVCSTGKIARIVSTLEGTDLVRNKAVPIEVVRREIGQLASNIRDCVINEASPSQVVEYNTSTLSPLSLEMKTRFKDQVDFVYVKGLGLSENVLRPIIELYTSEF